jgi:hypothetical protein
MQQEFPLMNTWLVRVAFVVVLNTASGEHSKTEQCMDNSLIVLIARLFHLCIQFQLLKKSIDGYAPAHLMTK